MQTSGVSGLPAADPSAGHGFAALGKDEFLKLFITKIENQDPLSPANDEALVAQLAQFSTLEQQIQSKDLLSQLVQSQDAASRARLMELLGRRALVGGDVPLHVAAGAPEPLQLELAGDAARLTVEILDRSGAIVRTLDLGASKAGRIPLGWDGRDEHGLPAADGDYTYRINASDAAGGAVAARGLLSLRIDALRAVGGTLLPLSLGRPIDLNDIIEVTT